MDTLRLREPDARGRTVFVARLLLTLASAALVVVAALVVLPSWSGGATQTTGLTPQLSEALDAARDDAARDGVQLTVTSGYRSAQDQQALWEEAVAEHGSERSARRWVLPPAESQHVAGEAIDVSAEGADWLEQHGATYGLCRRYANEWWHFELRTEPGGTCPPLVRDASGERG